MPIQSCKNCESNLHLLEIESLKGALYHLRDTIIGKFDGNNIDTLIAEPIDMTIDRSLWDWRIYGKNNTVDTLILSQRFIVRLIQEGDLDGNGTEEFGVRRETDAGTWDNYCIYTYDKGEWKYLIEPIWTYSDHFYIDLNKRCRCCCKSQSARLCNSPFQRYTQWRFLHNLYINEGYSISNSE